MNRAGRVGVDWLIKWNLRSTDVAAMAAELDAASQCKSRVSASPWTHSNEDMARQR